MTQMDNKTLIYPELSYKLTGIFFKVHNELGRFCKERQYTDAAEILFKKEGIKFCRETKLTRECLGSELSFGLPDFIIENKIAVDFKAKKFITKEDYNQMLRYLRGGKYKLGLIVNFINTYLKPKRIAN